MGPQSCGSLNYGNFGTPGTKWHLGAIPWPSINYIIRGKVVASPKSRPWWVLWVCVCPWLVRAPKCYNYALTNLLFGLCRSMWVIDLLVNLPSPHPKALTRPFTLKVLWAKERTPIPSPFVVFTFGLTVESIKELGSASSCQSCLLILVALSFRNLFFFQTYNVNLKV
jgi:hypothetical protein